MKKYLFVGALLSLLIGGCVESSIKEPVSPSISRRKARIKQKESREKKTTQDKLTKWYSSTSNFSCERILKTSLRDPDSYKRESDFISSSDTGNTKKVMWRFRSKNGFGGYMPGIARCFVNKNDIGTNTTGSVRAEIANE